MRRSASIVVLEKDKMGAARGNGVPGGLGREREKGNNCCKKEGVLYEESVSKSRDEKDTNDWQDWLRELG